VRALVYSGISDAERDYFLNAHGPSAPASHEHVCVCVRACVSMCVVMVCGFHFLCAHVYEHECVCLSVCGLVKQCANSSLHLFRSGEGMCLHVIAIHCALFDRLQDVSGCSTAPEESPTTSLCFCFAVLKVCACMCVFVQDQQEEPQCSSVHPQPDSTRMVEVVAV